MSLSTTALRRAAGIAVLAAGFAGAGIAHAQTPAKVTAPKAPSVYGKINWGIWVDTDGCMHYWADGGAEGYMVDRVNPRTGKPVCLKQNTCLVANPNTLFATDSSALTAEGRKRLVKFFQTAGAFGYGIYGNTDSRASVAYNQGLSERRAASVAAVARSVGAVVYRQMGFSELKPVAPNNSPANMQLNRNVQIVCYRWSR